MTSATDKPVETEANCKSGDRMSWDGKPGQSAHKQENLGKNASDGGADETLFFVLRLTTSASDAGNEDRPAASRVGSE